MTNELDWICPECGSKNVTITRCDSADNEIVIFDHECEDCGHNYQKKMEESND